MYVYEQRAPLTAVKVQRARLQVSPVRQDHYYYSYDVKYCLSVRLVRVISVVNYAYLTCCWSIREGVPEGVEGSTYMGYPKLLTNLN